MGHFRLCKCANCGHRGANSLVMNRRLQAGQRSAAKNGGMDVVGDYATPLPMMVIAEMIGTPASDWSLFHAWSDGILRLSRTIVAFDAEAVATYASVRSEMAPYLEAIVARRRAHAQDDLLTRLVHAEFEGQDSTSPNRRSPASSSCFLSRDKRRLPTSSPTPCSVLLNIPTIARSSKMRQSCWPLQSKKFCAIARRCSGCFAQPSATYSRTFRRSLQAAWFFPLLELPTDDPDMFAEPNRFLIQR